MQTHPDHIAAGGVRLIQKKNFYKQILVDLFQIFAQFRNGKCHRLALTQLSKADFF